MGKPHIVMLDDSRTVLLTSRNALVAGGYDVSIATDPAQLDPAQMADAALILVDVNMPEIFGDDVVHILREQHGIRAPIYLYSTIGRVEGEQRAREAGANGFFHKVDPAALLRDVTSVLRQENEEEASRWEAELHTRLLQSMSEHLERVRHLTSARANLEQRLLRRSIALEIHGAGGECALMGFGQMRELGTELTTRLLDPMILVPEACWPQIAAWFASVCRYVQDIARGLEPSLSKDELRQECSELTRSLHVTSTPTFRPEATDEGLLTASSGRRLLVIDDSAVVRAVLASTLGDLGYPVATARNLEEAAHKLFAFDPEVVIADVQLPDVEGDEICRRLKSSLGRPLLVVFYSGLEKGELSRRANAAGADGCVGKEEGVDALVRCIEALFRDVMLF